MLRNNFFSKKSTNGLKTALPEFSRLSFFEFGTIFLLWMARKLGSPTLLRLGVSRDLELENKGTNTGLELVAEMNLIELGLVMMVYDGKIWQRWWYMAATMKLGGAGIRQQR